MLSLYLYSCYTAKSPWSSRRQVVWKYTQKNQFTDTMQALHHYRAYEDCVSPRIIVRVCFVMIVTLTKLCDRALYHMPTSSLIYTFIASKFKHCFRSLESWRPHLTRNGRTPREMWEHEQWSHPTRPLSVVVASLNSPGAPALGRVNHHRAVLDWVVKQWNCEFVKSLPSCA